MVTAVQTQSHACTSDRRKGRSVVETMIGKRKPQFHVGTLWVGLYFFDRTIARVLENHRYRSDRQSKGYME